MDWTEDYTDPLEEIRRAQRADRSAARRAEALARMQEGVDMFVQGKTNIARRPVAPVDDALKAYVLSRKFEHEGALTDIARQKAQRADPGNELAPMSWGAFPGMTRSEALRAGYGKAPKVTGPDEPPPEDWYTNLKQLGIDPSKLSRKEGMDLLKAQIAREGQVSAAVGAEGRRTEREEPIKAREAAADLRKEFQGQQTYKDTQAVATAYEKIQGTQPTAAGDISLIFGYMRMLDPASTVREGEFATAQQAGGVPDRVVAMYNGLLKGERLSPDVRQRFKQEARQVLAAQKRRYDQLAKQYRSLAKQYGIPEGAVVLDLGLQDDSADPLGIR